MFTSIAATRRKIGGRTFTMARQLFQLGIQKRVRDLIRRAPSRPAPP